MYDVKQWTLSTYLGRFIVVSQVFIKQRTAVLYCSRLHLWYICIRGYYCTHHLYDGLTVSLLWYSSQRGRQLAEGVRPPGRCQLAGGAPFSELDKVPAQRRQP
jgi:hypothetical protein